jgi:hypothetical protein
MLGNAFFAIALCPVTQGPQLGSSMPGRVCVLDYGAVADGRTDCTEAFQTALDAMGEMGGGVVWVPAGRYMIRGHLTVPPEVTLRGVWETAGREADGGGSFLLAVEGAGSEEGAPFITLRGHATLKGLAVLYPEQRNENPPVPYPWCVQGIGDNPSIVDCTLFNPYSGVDFGTQPAGRHYIRGLYMQSLRRGLLIDKCFDVGRVYDVHIWPFWAINGPAREFTRQQGEGFIIGRTDWEYMANCFAIGCAVGFRFVAREDGGGNVLLTQSGSDVGPVAVQVDNVQDHSGISFCNSQIMATVRVAETNRGPVKFTACGFWPVAETGSQAILRGGGHATFEGCHFVGWDNDGSGAPCIDADCAGLTVTSCDFQKEGSRQIVLGANVQSAIIAQNRLRGGQRIEDGSSGDVQIGLNTLR